MPHHRKKSTLFRESSSSSSQSSRSSSHRNRSHRPSRTSRPHQHHKRDRLRKDIEEASDTADGISVGKRIYKTIEKLESPAKKLGKLVLWSAPLILAGLEVRHEWHHHAHKRRMMEKEYEKAHLEIQLQLGKDGKKEGIVVEGTKSQGPVQEKDDRLVAPPSREVHILPYPAQVVEFRDERWREYSSKRDPNRRQSYLVPPIVPEVPTREVCENRRPRIRVKPPGHREVSFPRVKSYSDSFYEYRRW